MVSRFLQHALILVYLTLTASALFYTFTKVASPLPERIFRWNYGMMAPYQADTSWNFDVLYEGRLPNGEWQTIDIDRYMPYGFGERMVRKYLLAYVHEGEVVRRQKFTELASLVLAHERERGSPYTAVRVYLDTWDRSPAGYEALHVPSLTYRELLTTVQ